MDHLVFGIKFSTHLVSLVLSHCPSRAWSGGEAIERCVCVRVCVRVVAWVHLNASCRQQSMRFSLRWATRRQRKLLATWRYQSLPRLSSSRDGPDDV